MRELAEELAPALTIIFQSPLSTGIVPTDWRDAYTTPIFKKGEQYNLANYRTISLTYIIYKLKEHIMVSSMQHFEDASVTISTAFTGGIYVKPNSWSLWKN